MSRVNPHGQPIGAAVRDWQGCPALPRAPLAGQSCRLIPLVPAHAERLHQAFAADLTGRLWTYMPIGPFSDAADYRAWVAQAAVSDDPLFLTITDLAVGEPLGVASYLRMDPANGVVEVGYLTFAPALQRSRMATEAMYLMMKQAFDLGYRRYEWKCDALNAPSRRAAERLGFTYEGTFRQALAYKGRNRDTAWYAITDQDWPGIRAALESWLSPTNFDADGGQKRPLRTPPAGVFLAR